MDKTLSACISNGDVASLNLLLSDNPAAANEKIIWGDRNEVATDPLHFVSDCVFFGWLTNRCEGEIATTLLRYGAALEGADDAESPLIGATSLGAEKVALVLIEAGADVHASALFGATPLHWAAYMGLPEAVQKLIDNNAVIDAKCTEFQSTSLFWAVQGFSQYGPEKKRHQIEAAEKLIATGADLATQNIEGVSLIGRSRDSESDTMTTLLLRHGAE